ncbi:hypothetical protein DP117_10875 [Brasilonema sp. UFV-L1]|nr:hypothetical protein [Brasilonema sp. UFV-L1]
MERSLQTMGLCDTRERQASGFLRPGGAKAQCPLGTLRMLAQEASAGITHKGLAPFGSIALFVAGYHWAFASPKEHRLLQI